LRHCYGAGARNPGIHEAIVAAQMLAQIGAFALPGWGLEFGHLALITVTGGFSRAAPVHEVPCKPWLVSSA
jgi:hypothetical protein